MTFAENPAREQGPWDSSFAQLDTWDPAWAQTCLRMTMNPWQSGVLPRKTVELVCVALNAACTNLDRDATRRHIQFALEAGATREEILMILKMASLLSIHSCSLGAPMLLEEAHAAGAEGTEPSDPTPTPACDQMKALGQWNQAWDPFYELDPGWTDQFMATAIGIYAEAPMSAKLVELLSIALDAAYTHMYAPGTRRHIKAALRAGATSEEVMEVLKLCVVQGVQACNMAVPILAEEVERFTSRRSAAATSSPPD
jgi:alkylhydroperoxidase/carboxymuconolactone decarboxylase family protein YurZ